LQERIAASASRVTGSLNVTLMGAFAGTFVAPSSGVANVTDGAASPAPKVCPGFGDPKLCAASAFHVKA
jgi:hypothetical protein